MRWFAAILSLTICVSQALGIPGFPGQLAGDGLAVRFDPASKTPAGVIELGGKQYPFTGTLADKTITGKFTAGNNAFDFTLVKTGDDAFTLVTGKSRFALKGVAAANPLEDLGGANANPNPAPAPVQPAAAPAGAIIFGPQKINDKASSLDVATVMVPKGWVVDPDFTYQIDHSFFITNETVISDPKTGWALRFIPLDAFEVMQVAYQNAVQQGGGLLTLGGMELAPRVLAPQEYIREVIIPRYRNVQGAKLVGTEDLPKVTEQMHKTNAAKVATMQRMGREIRYGAARGRLEYPGPNGVTMQEDIYVCMEVNWDPNANAQVAQAGFGSTQTWLFNPTMAYSFVAPKGQMEQATPVLHTILASHQMTRDWFKYTDNIGRMLKQKAYDDTKAILAARAQITESQQKSWVESCKQAARFSNEVGHLLGGTGSYTDPRDPSKPPMTMPANGTPHMNSQGETQNFPPGSQPPPGSDWKPMEPAKPAD